MNGASRRPRERGVILIVVAILGLVLIGLVGLALDGAWVVSTSQQLRHAADAAALNGARYVKTDTDPFDALRTAALSVALANDAAHSDVNLDANLGNDPAGDIVVGFWDFPTRTFTPTLTGPNAVRVRAHRTTSNADGPLSLLFGPVFGKDESDVGVMSTAVLAPPLPPLILILDPDKVGALRINGTNSLNVPNGRVHANSTKNCGIQLVGTPYMFALRTTVVGTACYPAGTIEGGPVLDNQDPVLDPLANVLPTLGDWNAFRSSLPLPAGPTGAINASGTYNPGNYPNGLNITSTMVVTLNPGSYMFGREAKVGGSAYLTGNDVTLFLDKDVELDISGSGAGMTLSPPDSGPYFGITMFTHRFPSGGKLPKFKIGGGGAFLAEGVTYVPMGELIMGGIPGKEMGAIIAWQANTEGTTGFTITGAGIPPLTTGPDVAYLVE